jgi:predicted GNAT family N-acyltransferase
MKSIEISTDSGRLNLAMIHAFLSNHSYWVAGISRVFVLPEFRDRDLGKLLMSNILSHPELGTIVRYTLVTQDARALYAQYGFTSFANPERQMELLRPKAPLPPGNAQR